MTLTKDKGFSGEHWIHAPHPMLKEQTLHLQRCKTLQRSNGKMCDEKAHRMQKCLSKTTRQSKPQNQGICNEGKRSTTRHTKFGRRKGKFESDTVTTMCQTNVTEGVSVREVRTTQAQLDKADVPKNESRFSWALQGVFMSSQTGLLFSTEETVCVLWTQ